jgi:hypothetical protein
MQHRPTPSNVLQFPMTQKPTSPPRHTLTVDLGPLKPQWQAWCAQQSTTPSQALRSVIQKLLTSKTPTDPIPEVTDQQGQRDQKRVRREISLTQSENHHLEQRAKQAGFSVPKWLIALVRHQLTKQPQLGHQEQSALTESNRQLLAIAKNLNQLSKAPNGNNELTPEALSQLSEYLEHHVAWVSSLIEANTERWKLN